MNRDGRRMDGRVGVPTVLQMEATECGAASLAMILGHYGLRIPLEQLRVDCGVSRDGSNAKNILLAARARGCVAKGMRLDLHELEPRYFPLIIYWEFNHFVVLEGRKGDIFFLNDPGCGPRRVTREQMDSSYTGVALHITPGADFQPSGRAPSLIAGLYRRVQGMRAAVLFIMLTSILLAVPGLIIPSLFRVFVDEVLGPNPHWLVPVLLAMLGSTALAVLLTWLQQSAIRRLTLGFLATNSTRMLAHLLRLPMSFHAQRDPGEVQHRIRLHDQLAKILSGQAGSAFAGLFMLIFYGALLLDYDIPLAVTGMALAGVNILVLVLVARSRKVLSQSLIQEESKLMGTSMSGVQLMETLKASAVEYDFFARWAGHYARYCNAHQRMALSAAYLSAVPWLLTGLNAAIILVFGAWRVMHGDMTAGMLVAFQSLMSAFLLPISQLTELGSQIQEAKGSLDKLDDVATYARDPIYAHENDLPAYGQRSAIRGELELRGVTFGYSPVAPPLITDFCLHLRPGCRVAVVGRSGSGKSTVAKLAAGLYSPWSGEVLYDGKPITQWPRRHVERMVAMVDQHILVFHDTVRENLSMWNPLMQESEIIRACRDAGIHDDIVRREGGYTAMMREGGGNFSGGQRQRIEIARALCADPAILILDEATSALDPETELYIDQRLRQRGCACLIVAHRLSTIRDCDEIIVLDQGHTVQRGTHEQLIGDEHGVYARMIRAEG